MDQAEQNGEGLYSTAEVETLLTAASSHGEAKAEGSSSTAPPRSSRWLPSTTALANL